MEDPDDFRSWYSIPEAAEFLGVSQPTIFRWMKQGALSFYKVGNATRFTRENLTAVVEKMTGSKEAESASARCAVCGHAHLIAGRIQGTGRLYFHPDRSRFWTLEESMVPTRVQACTACGYVQMHVDVEHLRKLLRDEDRAEPPENE